MRKYFAFCALLLWISPLSTGALTLSTQQQLSTADYSATFDAIVAGQSLQAYVEDQLQFAMQDVAGLIAAFGSDQRKTGLYYGDGGNYSWLSIATSDGQTLDAVSLLLGSGWSNSNERFLRWRSYRNGQETAQGEQVFRDGQTLLMEDPQGFDQLELAVFNRSGEVFGNYQAIAVDEVRARVFSAVPLPASAWFFVSGLAGLSIWRRRFSAQA